MNHSSGRGIVALGCVMLALAIAGEAIASHALPGRVEPALVLRFERALHYLIIHGLALIALAAQLRTPVQRIAAAILVIGVALFCGSLALSVAWPDAGITKAAPLGGSLIILSWTGLAAGFLLQRR